jgi:hypothetical protein
MPTFAGEPTWDLLLGVCLLLVIVYGFIIGQSKTIKTLLALYPAYFIADLAGAFLPTAFPSFFPDWKIAFINGESTKIIDLSPTIDMSSVYTIVGIKIFIFFLAWLLITVKSPFTVEIPENRKTIGGGFLHFIISLAFGFLFVDIVLLLLSGYSIFAHSVPSHILSGFMEQSFLITMFIKFYGSWFAVPAFVLILSGFLHAPVKDDEIEEESEGEENTEK